MPKINYGSTLRIKLTDNYGTRVFYEEPFTLNEYSNAFSEALQSFRENAKDAISRLRNDIEISNRLADINDHDLAAALRVRGWRVEEVD